MSGSRTPPPGARAAAADRERLFSFAGAGWVLAVAALIALGLLLYWIVPVLRHPHPRATGDGRTVESYRFDLADLRVPRAALAASGLPKDGLPALDAPPVFPAKDLPAFNEERRRARAGKYLVGADRVIGVVINGEARAYPVRLLSWHEVVNDTLGGVPIAVTYSPLGDAAVVFERPAGPAGTAPLSFGVSGLLYNSNTLVYDRGDHESLWAPLQLRAIAGPQAGAGTRLVPVPCQLTRWQTWIARYPDSSVLRPDPTYAKRYKKEPYRSYYGSDGLRFPIVPPPRMDGTPLKLPLVVLEHGGEIEVVPFPAAVEGDQRVVRADVGGRPVRVVFSGTPPAGFVEAEDGEVPPVRAWAFRFAWEAIGTPSTD